MQASSSTAPSEVVPSSSVHALTLVSHSTYVATFKEITRTTRVVHTLVQLGANTPVMRKANPSEAHSSAEPPKLCSRHQKGNSSSAIVQQNVQDELWPAPLPLTLPLARAATQSSSERSTTNGISLLACNRCPQVRATARPAPLEVRGRFAGTAAAAGGAECLSGGRGAGRKTATLAVVVAVPLPTGLPAGAPPLPARSCESNSAAAVAAGRFASRTEPLATALALGRAVPATRIGGGRWGRACGRGPAPRQ